LTRRPQHFDVTRKNLLVVKKSTTDFAFPKEKKRGVSQLSFEKRKQ